MKSANIRSQHYDNKNSCQIQEKCYLKVTVFFNGWLVSNHESKFQPRVNVCSTNTWLAFRGACIAPIDQEYLSQLLTIVVIGRSQNLVIREVWSVQWKYLKNGGSAFYISTNYNCSFDCDWWVKCVVLINAKILGQ